MQPRLPWVIASSNYKYQHIVLTDYPGEQAENQSRDNKAGVPVRGPGLNRIFDGPDEFHAEEEENYGIICGTTEQDS